MKMGKIFKRSRKKPTKISEMIRECIVNMFKAKVFEVINHHIELLEKREIDHLKRGERSDAYFYSICISEIQVLKTKIEEELNRIKL